LVSEASAWLAGMETNAVIVALCVFTVIVFRVRSVERPTVENCSFRGARR
jgi:hypothetical protein